MEASIRLGAVRQVDFDVERKPFFERQRLSDNIDRIIVTRSPADPMDTLMNDWFVGGTIMGAGIGAYWAEDIDVDGEIKEINELIRVTAEATKKVDPGTSEIFISLRDTPAKSLQKLGFKNVGEVQSALNAWVKDLLSTK